jgi:hypothetical protein
MRNAPTDDSYYATINFGLTSGTQVPAQLGQCLNSLAFLEVVMLNGLRKRKLPDCYQNFNHEEVKLTLRALRTALKPLPIDPLPLRAAYFDRVRELNRKLQEFYTSSGCELTTERALLLSSAEILLLADALELETRFNAGQMDLSYFPHALHHGLPEYKIRQANFFLGALRVALNPGLLPGYNRGIGWGKDLIQQQIYHGYRLYKSLLAFDNAVRGINNTHSGPVLAPAGYPLPTLTLLAEAAAYSNP